MESLPGDRLSQTLSFLSLPRWPFITWEPRPLSGPSPVLFSIKRLRILSLASAQVTITRPLWRHLVWGSSPVFFIFEVMTRFKRTHPDSFRMPYLAVLDNLGLLYLLYFNNEVGEMVSWLPYEHNV